MTERDIDQDPDDEEAVPRSRPAWVDEQAAGQDQIAQGWRVRREIRQQQAAVPVPRHLWEPVLTWSLLAAVAAWLTALLVPRSFPLWELTLILATATAMTWYFTQRHTMSAAISCWLATWGIVITAWITWARIAGLYHARTFIALLLPVLVLTPLGASVISHYRDRMKRAADTGRYDVNARQCQWWENLLHLPDIGVHGVKVQAVVKVDGGRQVRCQLGKIVEGRRTATISSVAGVADIIAQHLRLPRGAVYIEESPPGMDASKFIIHVTDRTGPRLSRYLPAENTLLSITREFAVGVLDTGRPFLLKLREVVVFVCGLRGSGKSTLLNVIIAQLARCPDALIFVIDLKGGQEAMAWLLPWLTGQAGKPVIDWLATTREEAKVMLEAVKRAGVARAESGRYGKKLIPGIQRRSGEMVPGIIVICDESARMTGHFTKEDGIHSSEMAKLLLQIAETFRSVAIDPVISAVRPVVDATGNSGIKAQSEVTFGLRVRTADEGRMVFGDNYQAAKQLAQLKDKGMFIPKVGAELFPPVHGFNITDGQPDDDGNPTTDMITPIAIACAARRPEPEQMIIDAMGEAYANRWDQPHIKQLLASWKTEAGVRDPVPLRSAPPVPEDGDDDFARWAAELAGTASTASGTEDSKPLNPVCQQMYELLIARGPLGYRVGILWDLLHNEGLGVDRKTLHRWLADGERQGYVRRTGNGGPGGSWSRWIWCLKPGAEFDIPGWRH